MHCSRTMQEQLSSSCRAKPNGTIPHHPVGLRPSAQPTDHGLCQPVNHITSVGWAEFAKPNKNTPTTPLGCRPCPGAPCTRPGIDCQTPLPVATARRSASSRSLSAAPHAPRLAASHRSAGPAPASGPRHVHKISLPPPGPRTPTATGGAPPPGADWPAAR